MSGSWPVPGRIEPPSVENLAEARRAVEAMLLVASDPTPVQLLAQLVELPVDVVESMCRELAVEYERERRGFVLVEVAGGWRYQTHPDTHAYVERFALEGVPNRLSSAALETLAIVAYKQPISRGQIGAIRGVNVDGVLRTLVQRGYVDEQGRDDGPGQATLFGTTPFFLEQLGLVSLDDLPPLGDFVPSAEVLEALEQTLKVDGGDEIDLTTGSAVASEVHRNGDGPDPGSGSPTPTDEAGAEPGPEVGPEAGVDGDTEAGPEVGQDDQAITPAPPVGPGGEADGPVFEVVTDAVDLVEPGVGADGARGDDAPDEGPPLHEPPVEMAEPGGDGDDPLGGDGVLGGDVDAEVGGAVDTALWSGSGTVVDGPGPGASSADREVAADPEVEQTDGVVAIGASGVADPGRFPRSGPDPSPPAAGAGRAQTGPQPPRGLGRRADGAAEEEGWPAGPVNGRPFADGDRAHPETGDA